MSNPNADAQALATVTGEDAKIVLTSVEMKKFLEENPNATEQEQRAHADAYTTTLNNEKEADLVKKALQAIDDRTRAETVGNKETTTKDPKGETFDKGTSDQTITREQAEEAIVHDAMRKEFGHPPTTEQEAKTQKARADEIKEGLSSKSTSELTQSAQKIIDGNDKGKDTSQDSNHRMEIRGLKNSQISNATHVDNGTTLQPRAIAVQNVSTARSV